MNIAICDDEQIFLDNTKEQIENVCKKFNIEYEIFCFENGQSLIENINSLDIIFLDIELKKESGFDIATKIYNKYPDIFIIFLTSHEEMVYEGYRVRAFRFLKKPLDNKYLEESLCSAYSNYNANFIEIKYNKHSYYINLREVTYIETRKQQHGVIIHFKKNISNKLKSLTEVISTEENSTEHIFTDLRSLDNIAAEIHADYFFRIHRCVLINMNFVEYYEKSHVIMNSSSYNATLPISRRKYEDFKIKHITNRSL